MASQSRRGGRLPWPWPSAAARFRSTSRGSTSHRPSGRRGQEGVAPEGSPQVGGPPRPRLVDGRPRSRPAERHGPGIHAGTAKEGESRRHDVALADVALLETDVPQSVTSSPRLHGFHHRGPGGAHRLLHDQPEELLRLLPDVLRALSGRDEPDRPQAEGFSESIARVLEARDLDALLVERPAGRRSRS